MTIIEIIVIGIVLSLDVFSISLLLSLNKNKVQCFPFIVSLFHFLFPFITNFIGIKFIKSFNINNDYILIFIYLYLLIEVLTSNNQKKGNYMNIYNLLFLSFSVSIDSLTLGFGLYLSLKQILVASLIFSIMAYLFSKIGLMIGNRINYKYNKYSKVLSIILLILMLISKLNAI